MNIFDQLLGGWLVSSSLATPPLVGLISIINSSTFNWNPIKIHDAANSELTVQFNFGNRTPNVNLAFTDTWVMSFFESFPLSWSLWTVNGNSFVYSWVNDKVNPSIKCFVNYWRSYATFFRLHIIYCSVQFTVVQISDLFLFYENWRLIINLFRSNVLLSMYYFSSLLCQCLSTYNFNYVYINLFLF